MATPAPRYVVPNVLSRLDPVRAPVPLVYDSPHSGRAYPPEFDFVPPFEVIRRGEDAYVDEMIASAAHEGASVLNCEFPRTFIDVNRDVVDIDEQLLDAPWPGEVRSYPRGSIFGSGLVWRLALGEVPIYDHKLSIEEVQHRIDAYYQPYHDMLGWLLKRQHRRFGAVWHINWHSCPPLDRLNDNRPVADFILGDRDGSSCEPEFTAVVETFLKEQGFQVARNAPFKGAHVVAHYGKPEQGFHSLQIEMNRKLYLRGDTTDKSDNFEAHQQVLERLTSQVAAFVRERIAP